VTVGKPPVAQRHRRPRTRAIAGNRRSLASVQELDRLCGVATPAIDVMLALVQERGRQAGLYTPLVAVEDPRMAG